MKALTINEIRDLEMVAIANEWKDRIYIKLKGNGGNFAGERNSKVWVKDGKLNVEIGKGTCSSDWNASLKALKAVFA